MILLVVSSVLIGCSIGLLIGLEVAKFENKRIREKLNKYLTYDIEREVDRLNISECFFGAADGVTRGLFK